MLHMLSMLSRDQLEGVYYQKCYGYMLDVDNEMKRKSLTQKLSRYIVPMSS